MPRKIISLDMIVHIEPVVIDDLDALYEVPAPPFLGKADVMQIKQTPCPIDEFPSRAQ